MPSYYPKQEITGTQEQAWCQTKESKTNHSYVYKSFKVPTCLLWGLLVRKQQREVPSQHFHKQLSNQGQPQRYMMVNLTVQPKRQAAIMSPFKNWISNTRQHAQLMTWYLPLQPNSRCDTLKIQPAKKGANLFPFNNTIAVFTSTTSTSSVPSSPWRRSWISGMQWRECVSHNCGELLWEQATWKWIHVNSPASHDKWPCNWQYRK